MTFGSCHLCLNPRGLIQSHVWPAWAYKHYVSNQAGRFVDLERGLETSEQYKRPWFCHSCDNEVLSAGEGSTRKLLARLERQRDSPQTYYGPLLRFAASISWRTMKLYYGESDPWTAERLFPACETWRQFIRGEIPDVGRFTQHAFVVIDPKGLAHKVLGGQPFLDRGIVLSRVGPLVLVGRLADVRLRGSERAIWRRSQVRVDGGSIAETVKWDVGGGMTWGLMEVIKGHERQIRRRFGEVKVEEIIHLERKRARR